MRESLILHLNDEKIHSGCILVLAAIGVNSQTTLPVSSSLLGGNTGKEKKFDYGLTLGSEFSSVSGFGSALNTYISPRFSYRLGKKFKVGGGFTITETNYFNALGINSSDQFSRSSGSFTSGTVFINGQYALTDRLTLSGSAFKQFPISGNPLPYNPFTPINSRGAQGVDLNIGYKIGEHMFIQAGFRYTDGVNPAYGSPFGNSYYSRDPFGSVPGRSGQGW